MSLRIDGESVFKNGERVGHIGGSDEFGWTASILVDLLDPDSNLGRYVMQEFPTRELAEAWLHENEHQVHAFTRRPSNLTVGELVCALGDVHDLRLPDDPHPPE